MFELRRVSASYGSTPVLRGVDLVVPTGSVVALLGPNGAGKTTLLKVASGLLEPSSGQVLVDGVDLTGRAPHVMVAAGVAHIPEGRGIFRNLTVRENLSLLGPGLSEDEAVARGCEAFPRLGQRLAQKAGTMSGGEQQMLALARAYISSPQVVLLDEVSMGLAPLVVDAIFEFVGRLAAAGVSLLLVEQFVTRALAAADYVYVLNRGRIGFAGEPSELDGDDVFSSYVGAS